MTSADKQSQVNESKLTSLLVQKKIITDGQLKAAVDYQRSLGGQLSDVLVKLGLVRASQLEELLERLEKGDDEGGAEGRSEHAVDPASVKVSDLKVHRRLLEKLPKALVEEYLLVIFFPAAVVGSRRIIVGHGMEISLAVEERVRSIVGVDLATLELDESIARQILDELRPAEAVARKPASRDKNVRSIRPPGVGDETILNALLSILAKRGLVTAEELQVETEHLEERA